MIRLRFVYEKVTKYHGIKKQVKKFYEEFSEFKQEMLQMLWKEEDACIERMQSEAADLINMILQLVVYFGGSIECIMLETTRKMNREVNRIDSGHYD